ncbi:uncharacterized protein LOC116343555 [Contarinia nasturtii]|uniref:uncharacterized protein LOC116343555 n=1 Tax=Contarinia nasturtii TaxID=265458 RepID=UPI0012D37CF6|nr:uncharacterized protein LOC116343555 [Contarinia nasturtii]
MRFPLKVVLSAVLAKNIVAELVPSSAQQKFSNEVDFKYPQDFQKQQLERQQAFEQQQAYQEQDFQQQQQNFDQQQAYQQQQDFDQQEEGFEQQPEQDPTLGQQEFQQRSYDPVSVPDYVQNMAKNAGQDLINNQSAEDVSFDPYSGQSSQYEAAYGPSAYNQGGFYLPNAFNSPGSYNIQTGYHGYLVPFPPKEPVDEPKATPFSSFTSLSRSVPDMMRQAGTTLARAISYLFSWFGFTVFGGAATTAICTFTPLCSITFPLVKSVGYGAIKSLGLEDAMTDSWVNLMKGTIKYTGIEKKLLKSMSTEEKSTVDQSGKSAPEPSTKSMLDKNDKPKQFEKTKLKEVETVKADSVSDTTRIADTETTNNATDDKKFEPSPSQKSDEKSVTK